MEVKYKKVFVSKNGEEYDTEQAARLADLNPIEKELEELIRHYAKNGISKPVNHGVFPERYMNPWVYIFIKQMVEPIEFKQRCNPEGSVEEQNLLWMMQMQLAAILFNDKKNIEYANEQFQKQKQNSIELRRQKQQHELNIRNKLVEMATTTDYVKWKKMKVEYFDLCTKQLEYWIKEHNNS